ncbi:MAG: hypothetical protein MUF23_03990 [Pirellula sp.]|jgi:hypothetical protein|nr:hypothetical protein [Pirellula sp.]
MNSNQEHSDDDVDRWLQTWGSKDDCQVNPAVRAYLLRRAARPRTSNSPRVQFAIAAAAGIGLILGSLWIAMRNRTDDPKPIIAHAEPIPDIQQLKKESAEALDALAIQAKLLEQKLLLIQLKASMDREMTAIRDLRRKYETRVRLDRVILASYQTPDQPTQP